MNALDLALLIRSFKDRRRLKSTQTPVKVTKKTKKTIKVRKQVTRMKAKKKPRALIAKICLRIRGKHFVKIIFVFIRTA